MFPEAVWLLSSCCDMIFLGYDLYNGNFGKFYCKWTESPFYLHTSYNKYL